MQHSVTPTSHPLYYDFLKFLRSIFGHTILWHCLWVVPMLSSDSLQESKSSVILKMLNYPFKTHQVCWDFSSHPIISSSEAWSCCPCFCVYFLCHHDDWRQSLLLYIQSVWCIKRFFPSTFFRHWQPTAKKPPLWHTHVPTYPPPFHPPVMLLLD